MAGIRVVKMSGAGNDFLLLGREQARRLADLPAWTRRVCRRGLSVGADGVLVVERVGRDRVAVSFLNPDGSPAFCGNGTRCAARYSHLQGLAGESMVLETANGDVAAAVLGDTVRLHLPAPRDLGAVEIDLGSERLAGRFVFAGVPHFVVFVDAPSVAPLARWGPAARSHPRFGPEGTNFDLAHAEPGQRLELRTWERGVEGETLSCGSGAVAAAYAARLAGGDSHARVLPASGVAIEIHLPGGPSDPHEAVMVGDARLIFEGELSAEATAGFPP